MANQIIPIRAH